MNYIFIDVHSPNVRGNHEVHQVIQSLALGTSPPRLQQHRGSTTPEAELQPGRGWNPLDPMGSDGIHDATNVNKSCEALPPGPAKHAQRIDLGAWAVLLKSLSCDILWLPNRHLHKLGSGIKKTALGDTTSTLVVNGCDKSMRERQIAEKLSNVLTRFQLPHVSIRLLQLAWGHRLWHTLASGWCTPAMVVPEH